MRALVQRVSQASVTVEHKVVGQIGQGLLVLLGVGHNDTIAEAHLLAEKVAQLRIFSDAEGRFNLALGDVGGAVLAVSQFTLYADVRRGRRPGFSDAARLEVAAPLIDAFCAQLRTMGFTVATGQFGTHMEVALVNDGPVTIMIDSDIFGSPRHG